MTSYLYSGKILWVDLTREEASIVPTERYANYLGGRGINARLLYENVGVETDALSPENVLCFGAGPLAGTTFPQSCRTDVMFKSPVTGLIGNSNFGGSFAGELKHAGWDHIVLAGKAPHPVYIFIHNDVVEIRDARPYWGMETFATGAAIRADIGNQNYKVVCIGPAGERLVTYASLQAEMGAGAWRTGAGAVMGSKNCKAIAVRGTKGVAVADAQGFLAASERLCKVLRSNPHSQQYSAIGHTRDQIAIVRSGAACGSAAHETAESYADKYDYEDRLNEWGTQMTGCGACPVQCKPVYDVPGVGPAVLYCTQEIALDAGIRNEDMALTFKMLMDAQRQGIDAISMGPLLQWLGLLWERGIIDESITDGCQLEWGNGAEFERMFWKTIERKGFGDKLAQGMKVTADYLDTRIPAEKRGGKSTYCFALQTHNNPLILHAGVRAPGMALAIAIGRRSDVLGEMDTQELDQMTLPAFVDLELLTQEELEEAEEKRTAWAIQLTGTPEAVDPHGYRGRAAIVHDFGVINGVVDCLGTCKVGTRWEYQPVNEPEMAECLSLGLGRAVTPQELAEAALRNRNLERALECTWGRRRAQDTIPECEFDQPISHGLLKGQLGTTREGLERMKSEYYLIRGWDQQSGVPYKETLLEYGLDDVAEDLATLGILSQRPDGESTEATKKPALAWVLVDEMDKGNSTAVEVDTTA